MKECRPAAVVALGVVVLTASLSMTACPALLSDDFRIVADSGATADGASSPQDAEPVPDAETETGAAETGADSGSGASSSGSGLDAGDARDAAPPTLCCSVQGDPIPCANSADSYWVCFSAGQTTSCTACAAGEGCQLGNQDGLIPGDTGSVEICP